MYKTLKVPVIGIIENMSYVVCESCGAENILYNNAIDSFVKELDMDILGKIPLEKEIINCCETGVPSCIKFPDSKFTESYNNIAKTVIGYLDDYDKIANEKCHQYFFLKVKFDVVIDFT